MRRTLIIALALALLCGVCLGLNCPKCGKEIPPGTKFCPGCGQKLTLKCPKCGGEITFGDRFCAKCGTRLTWPGQQPGPGPATKPSPPVEPEAPKGPAMDSGDIFAQASPAVVRVNFKNKAGEEVGLGSGFLVSADGYVVTNYHVIASAWSAEVVMNDKKKYPVLGYAAVEPDHDLAVIRINGKGLPFLEVAPGGMPRVGTKACAIGYPKGLPCTLSEGIVSGQPEMPMITGQKLKVIQTTAAISQGSSGGPLLTGYGKVLVVGVTTGSVTGGQSLNLVVPAEHVRALLAKKDTIRRLPPPMAQIIVPPPAEGGPPKYERKFTDPFDQEVVKGVERAANFLWSTRKEDGSWKSAQLQLNTGVMEFEVGPTALCCYALLESGVSVQDLRMAKTLRWLARKKNTRTYTLALRANVWLAASRQDAQYLKNLQEDVKALVKGTKNGSYTYECVGDDFPGDNSNSQYGLLGVWAGAQANLEDIPMQYWDVVSRHWKKAQNPDGGWGYHSQHRSKSYPAMAVAGLASLFVCADNLEADKFAKCGANAHAPAIEKGLAWLDQSVRKVKLDSVLEDMEGHVTRLPLDMYYLFGVERVGLASGYKYFGDLPWYKTGATLILQNQRPNGMVPGMPFCNEDAGTAYALLFLVRGRHPVIFNKLKFDSDWNNRPRDLASLTRWLSGTFERQVNWQIIGLKDPVEEWHDAPILYVSASRDPGFTEQNIQTLRTFVNEGGTIFSCTECNGAGFSKGMREAYERMFPQYKLQPLDPKHDLFSAHFKVHGLQFSMISNGVRPLAIHTDFDLPLSWQEGRSKTRRWTFEIAANIAMYVTGKEAFRPRGITHWPPDEKFTPVKTVKLARLKHEGNCDPEPLAYERFRRLIGQRNQITLEVVGPIAIGDLPASGAKVATLTGTGKLTLSEADRKVLQSFAAGGGTLVIDATGGDAEFDKSARAILTEMYGGQLRMLATVSKLLNQPKMEIKKVRYRGPARARIGRTNDPALRAVVLEERAAVIYSREDITGGLVGYDSATCDGYDPDSAFEIMRNIVNLAG